MWMCVCWGYSWHRVSSSIAHHLISWGRLCHWARSSPTLLVYLSILWRESQFRFLSLGLIGRSGSLLWFSQGIQGPNTLALQELYLWSHLFCPCNYSLKTVRMVNTNLLKLLYFQIKQSFERVELCLKSREAYLSYRKLVYPESYEWLPYPVFLA